MKFLQFSLVRHRQRGSVYVIVAGPDVVRIEATNVPAYAYKSNSMNPTIWVRPQSEMEDGRFESI